MVPGLGQIVQGVQRKDMVRLSKGLFFLIVLWGMFFYGANLGRWKNVYLPHFNETQDQKDKMAFRGILFPDLLANLYFRLHYAGQFWVGLPAWPALWNYYNPDTPILGDWQASPGALTREQRERFPLHGDRAHPEQHRLIAETEELHNRIQLLPSMGRLWNIAELYTVLAGILNLLVIYDAFAGPLFPRNRAALQPAAPTS
jgi:hypothetical protein